MNIGDGTESGASRLGEKLYAALFGGLSAEETEQPKWLLSLDDALFQLPFAALVVTQKGGERRSGTMEYLVERHSVQVVPGALHFNAERSGAKGAGDGGARWFLGVGDPIYNLADARWKAARFSSWFLNSKSNGQLNRLVGSGSEVESCARSWAGGSTVLTGARADRATFLNLAERGPSVIHLATHVVASATRQDEALAFGLGRAGTVETLRMPQIAAMHVPGAVVAMTGCESGGGDVQPGTGLLGLTRAWQEAGAQSVIATLWPVSDTSSGLFASFYRHLQTAPAAEALRSSQLEMLRSNSKLRSPDYWAAFQVTGDRK